MTLNIGKTGSALPEPASALPEQLSSYKRTSEFTEKTIPAGLLKAHSTKEGVWGLIRIVEGELLYRILDERRVQQVAILTPAASGVVEPGIMHEVELLGHVRFYVEFFARARQATSAALTCR